MTTFERFDQDAVSSLNEADDYPYFTAKYLELPCKRVKRSSTEMEFRNVDQPSCCLSLYSAARERSAVSFALGLRHGFLDTLESFSENIRYHRTLQGWVLIFLENNYEEIEDEALKYILSKELLVRIGFRENSEAITEILSRSKLQPDHVDPIDAAKRFVNDEFKYNPVLSRTFDSFKKDFESESNSSTSIDILNAGIDVACDGTITEDHSSRIQISKRLSELCQDDVDAMLFHGTDVRSAEDIRLHGIDINLGFQKRDFSDGSGFYLTNNYQHARTWAFSQTRKPAVLVYKIPKTHLENAQTLKLTEKSNEVIKWKEVVTQNRAGKPSKKLRNFLRTYDGIEGPISVVCESGSNATPDSKQVPREAKQDSYQFCIISECFADEIGAYLNTLITYDEL